MTALSLAILAASACAAVALLVLGLPGNWLLLGGVLLAAAVSPKAAVTLGVIATLAGLCLLAELLEWLCGVFGAKRYGVSAAGIWGAIIGGFLGALAGGAVLPILGAFPGGLAGTFLGAFGVELSRGAGRREALRLGMKAFIARMVALAVKVAVTLAMAGLGLIWLI